MEFQISDNKPQWREAGADTWNFFNGSMEFDMYAFSSSQMDWANSLFKAQLNNSTVTLTLVYGRENTGSLSPSSSYRTDGVFYRTSTSGNYTGIGKGVTLQNVDYIEIIVSGYYTLSNQNYTHAKVKIE